VRFVVATIVIALFGASCRPGFREVPLDRLLEGLDPTSVLVGCDRTAERLVLTTSTHLDPSCTYTAGVDITGSEVTLDCRGARIDDPSGSGRVGILVSAPTDVALHGVTVRNCVVSRFLNNVRVTRTGFKSLPVGNEYEHAFTDITIEHSHLYSSRGSGVFVDGYVTDVTLDELDISGSGSVGIYFEAGSRANTVTGSTIVANGFGDVKPEGAPFSVGSLDFRYESTGREGIAVDGSRDNVITGNTLAGNSAGGIFLYKNCGEYATEKLAQWWTRPYGATGNLIEGNDLSWEDNGVWVGSRMAENQTFLDCSDPTYGPSDALTRIHLDQADDNTVRGNSFDHVRHGVRVEDDGTVVDANTFTSDRATHEAVIVGTKRRTRFLAEPVSGTVLTANVATIAGNPDPFTWIHGHVLTTESGNLADGLPSALAPGTQPTVNPWLFVVRFWQVP